MYNGVKVVLLSQIPIVNYYMQQFKLITIKMDLVIDENITDHNQIADYLNNKMYTDPDFFGEFGPENIIEVKDFEY